MKLNSFLKECSEKEVYKMLSIYIVSSWVLIQVLAVTWQPLALPEKSVTVLIIALLLGFPVYIFYIWKIRLAKLEKPEGYITKKGKKKRSKFKQMYFSFLAIISVIVVVAVSFIANNAFGNSLSLPDVATTDKIGILHFGNNTGDTDFDIVSKMTSDWVTHGITQNKLGQVISPEIVSDYISIIKATEANVDNQTVLKNYFKPGKVITGNFFLNEAKLIFQSSIRDGNIDKTLISFDPIECESENPLDCIEALKQLILGYFSTEQKKELNLQDTPPKYKAYQYLLDAKTNFGDGPMYLDLLNKAIAEDRNYFEPKVLRVGYYYNDGDFKKADSLRRLITPNNRDNNRQINLLNHYEALLKGNSKKVYETIKNEYNFAPFDLQTNSSTMVVAQQFVNRPMDVDSIFNKISMTTMDISNCTFCEYRYYVQGLSLLEIKAYSELISTLTPVLKEVNELYLKRPVLAAYVRSNDLDGLSSFLLKEEMVVDKEELFEMYLFVGKEFLLLKDHENAKNYFLKIIDNPKSSPFKESVALANYYLDDFKAAEELYAVLLKENPEDVTLLSRYATCLAKNGKQGDADDMISQLQNQSTAYQYGAVDYAHAQHYAAIGNHDDALKSSLKSIMAGNSYTLQTYQNDPHFIELQEHQEFKGILNFWY